MCLSAEALKMSSTAYLNLRRGVPNRRVAFTNGLEKLGYKVKHGLPTYKPKEGDLLVTWNRIGLADKIARSFESIGCPVIVVENASWGNSFAGRTWYHISKKYHNVSNAFYIGSEDRWSKLEVDLCDWRSDGGESVILLQRGIGPPKTRMPSNFKNIALKKFPDSRIRPHPGMKPCTSIEDDLSEASQVVTWGSGAAIKALIMGIKVQSFMPKWIGEQDNTTDGRYRMFERLSWAQWDLDEIDSGLPFRTLL